MKAVILDVDGTLVDSNDVPCACMGHGLRRSGDHGRFRRRTALHRHGRRQADAGGVGHQASPRRSANASAHAAVRSSRAPTCRRFADSPGARDLLQRFLADGYVLAVASSAAEEELQPLLERAAVADLVHHRTSCRRCRDDSKPDPDIVQGRAEEAGDRSVRGHDVGDTPYDVEAATPRGHSASSGWRAAAGRKKR